MFRPNISQVNRPHPLTQHKHMQCFTHTETTFTTICHHQALHTSHTFLFKNYTIIFWTILFFFFLNPSIWFPTLK